MALAKLPAKQRRIHTQYLKLLREKKKKLKEKLFMLPNIYHINEHGQYKGSTLHKYLTKLHRLEYKLHKHRFMRSGISEHSNKRNRFLVAKEAVERKDDDKKAEARLQHAYLFAPIKGTGPKVMNNYKPDLNRQLFEQKSDKEKKRLKENFPELYPY